MFVALLETEKKQTQDHLVGELFSKTELLLIFHFHPESIIAADPNVQGVVIFGRSRNQVGVAVEPAYPVDLSNDKEIEKFRNAIWPFIEAANKFAPTHSRIFKEYILVCDVINKPFHRTSKGLVARNPVLTSYATEIDAIYENVEKAITSDWAQPPEKWDEDGLRAFVARIISGTIGVDGAPIDREGDLFAQGCDRLVSQIVSSL